MSSAPSKSTRRWPLFGVVAYLRRYPGPVALSVSLLLVNLSIEMAQPQIIGSTITQLRWHAAWGAKVDLWPFVLLFISLVATRAGVGIILGPIRNRLVQRTLNDIRADVYDSIQRLGFRYHDQSSTGELISRSTTDIWRLQDFLFACLFLVVDISVALVATITLIFFIHPLLGWLTLATMAPTVALIGFYAAKLQPQWRKVHDLHASMTTVIQENIAGVRVVKAFAKEEAEITKFRGKRDVFLGHLMETVNYWAARVPFAQFIFGLSTPLMLWIGGRMVVRNEIPVGDLAKVVFYLMAIAARMGAIGQFTNILQNASASAERLLEIVDEPKTLVGGTKPLPEGKGRVEFRQVSFGYQGGADLKPADPRNAESSIRKEAAANPPQVALHDVSFTVEPGQTVAIVGATGAGKSTLIQLVPRFYDPDSGDVFLDGVNLRELRLDELRRAVGLVFQETFLFSATVAANIAYGRPEATREQIEAAARAAQAHEFIAELEKGYDTIIGERGVSLSGGQRQRLAIARAFLLDPRILILDDATAAVDSHTERAIQEAMRKLSENRTTFVIAHRLSTIRHADTALILEKGRLVEVGPTAELLRTGGPLSNLFHDERAEARH
jgi:ABC-type multidrug transport system fused ATPase/permease subunit